MRNLLLALACGLLVSTTVGCMIPAYSADPARRTQELMFTSEGLRISWTNGSGSGSWISRTTRRPIGRTAASSKSAVGGRVTVRSSLSSRTPQSGCRRLSGRSAVG